MRKYFFSATGLLLLAACTSVTQYHNDCFSNLNPFVRQAACVQQQVSADQNLRQDPLAQEYVLTAVDLAHQVQAHRISDDQARLQLTHKLNETNHIRAENLAVQNAYDSPGFVQPIFVGGYYRH